MTGASGGSSPFEVAARRLDRSTLAPVVDELARRLGRGEGFPRRITLRGLDVDQIIGFRGPYGNAFPLDEWLGKSLVFIGGGIGMAALRAALLAVLRRREDYGEILILNGARSCSDLVFCVLAARGAPGFARRNAAIHQGRERLSRTV